MYRTERFNRDQNRKPWQAEHRMEIRRSLREWHPGLEWGVKWLIVGTLVILLAAGCKGRRNANGSGSSSAPGQTEAPADSEPAQSANGQTIDADATPKEVAQAALRAIEANDKEALRKLLAARKIKQDVQSITRGRAAFQGLVDKAVTTAVSAIIVEINGLDAEGREIDQESITGDTAVVTVKGKRDGQEHSRRFFLVQEDRQWRLVPSHR